jgi:hypothetical protein
VTAPSIAQDHQRDDAGNAATTANAAFAETAAQGRPVKVMIITMFGPEGQAWLDRLGPWRDVAVPGLSPDYPVVHCNRQDVCVVTTGMGYANASATIMALTFSPRFDLRRTYFLVSGIAGVDPAQGTVGSAAWSKYLVDFSLQWELDARDSRRLEHRLSRHQHEEPERQAAARLPHRSVPAQRAADRCRLCAVAQRRACRQRAGAGRAREVHVCAGEPAADGDPVRHVVGQYVVLGHADRRARVNGPRSSPTARAPTA